MSTNDPGRYASAGPARGPRAAGLRGRAGRAILACLVATGFAAAAARADAPDPRLGDGTLRLAYENKAPAVASPAVEARIEVLNASAAAVDLTGTELRYFLTPDGLRPRLSIKRSTPAAGVTAVFTDLGDDSYVGIRVGAGLTLRPGERWRVRFELEAPAGERFDQGDDVSFVAAQTAPGPNPTIALVRVGADPADPAEPPAPDPRPGPEPEPQPGPAPEPPPSEPTPSPPTDPGPTTPTTPGNAASGSLELAYVNKAPAVRSREIEAEVFVTNLGDAGVDLQGAELRYFLDPDGLTPQVGIKRSVPASGAVRAGFTDAGAGSYASFRVTGPLVLARGARWRLRFKVEATGNGEFDQGDDPSFLAGRTSPGPNPGIALVLAGAGSPGAPPVAPEPGTPEPPAPDPGTPDPETPDPDAPDPETPDPGTPPTPDPGAPGTPDPTPPVAAASLSIGYVNKAPAPRSREIEAQVDVTNAGPASVNLAGAQLRYFFDPDGLEPEITLRRSSPSGAVEPYVAVAGGASRAGVNVVGDLTLAPGERWTVRFKLEDARGRAFDQTDDRSYIAARTSRGPNPDIELVLGDAAPEPEGPDEPEGPEPPPDDGGGTDPPPATPSPKAFPHLADYELVFADEFDGATLDPSKWSTALLWGPYLPINAEQQLYVDTLGMHSGFEHSPFELTGETLRIVATPTSDELRPPPRPAADGGAWRPYPWAEFQQNRTEGTPGSAGYRRGYDPDDVDYLSGILTSYGSFRMTHGYVEMRAKVPPGRGLWPAFWLLPMHYVEDVPEIDVMEFLGQDVGTLYNTYHYFDVANDWRKVSTPSFPNYVTDWTADFHTFGMEWGPRDITWYVDGVATHSVDDAEYRISGQAMYLLANLAVGGSWPGAPDADTPFPASFEIDYIRAYDLSAAEELDLGRDYELMFADEFDGDSLDPDKWRTHFIWGPYLVINDEEQYYVDALGSDAGEGGSPFDVGDGKLVITARAADDPAGFAPPEAMPDEDDPIWDAFPSFSRAGPYPVRNYSSGIITSYDAFKFAEGYAEIRAKVPAGDGLWPAFWLLNGYYVALQPEIDVMEILGEDPSRVVHSYHRRAPDGTLASTSYETASDASPGGFADGFHTYGVRWRRGEITWYVDGTARHTYRGDDVGYQVMYVIANLAVGGNFNTRPVDEAALPARLEIDRIRVYQRRRR